MKLYSFLNSRKFNDIVESSSQTQNQNILIFSKMFSGKNFDLNVQI